MPSPQVLVRNLDPKAIQRLKNRARRHQRSFEAEVRAILHEAAGVDRADLLSRLRVIQQDFAGKQFSDSTELLRQDRER